MRDRRPQEGSAAADAFAQGTFWSIGRWCSAETQSVTPGSCWWFQLEGSLADLPKSWYACWHSWRSWSAACDRHCRFLDACSDNVTTGAAIMEGFTLYAAPQFPVSSLRSTTSRGSTTSEPTRSVAKKEFIKGFFPPDSALNSVWMPVARSLLPFVRLSCATPSRYSWWDDDGERHVVTQAGSRARGPSNAFAFLHRHTGRLGRSGNHVVPGEKLRAFLDDVYVLCPPERVKPIFDALARALFRVAGICLHLGKTKVWNKVGVEPEHIHTMGENAWQPSGTMVLGTPIGSEQFVSEKLQDRINKERRLWQAIPNVPDLQCGWQILLQSANPRANHTLRTLPLAMSADYALAHDEGLWETARALLGEVPHEDAPHVRDIATLPMRMGGLGLRSAVLCAHAAYWASWAADAVVESMSSHEEPVEECLGELKRATDRLDSEGFWWRPSWPDLRAGSRPETHVEGEPGEWRDGWQYWSSSISDSYFRKGTMLSGRTAARRAHLRSHSGRNAGAALAHCPTSPEFTIPPHLFRTLLLERMSLPLQMTKARCEGCHAQLDSCGHHRASCPRSGRVKKRATPTEHTVARIFREAGATVRKNVFLKDMNVEVGAEDARQIEVLAQDLPCFGGGAARRGRDFALCVELRRRGSPTRSRHRWCGAAESAGRQGDGIPGGGNVRPLQIGCHGHRNRRALER